MERSKTVALAYGVACAWVICASGCSDGGSESGAPNAQVAAPPAAGDQGATTPPPGAGTGNSALMADPTQPAPNAGSAGGAAPAPGGAGAAPADGVAAPLPGAGNPTTPVADPGDSPAPPPNATPSGPEDGDPSRPIVSVPGVPCGPNPSLFGLTSTNTTIGGRDVHVAYPCNKHGGAPVTFILNLHGTMPDESLKLYQVAYFSANNHADSHNFITVAPKSVVSQWGNGDGGVDRPHIMEVIDWVYSTFAEFDIRQMWVSGHSWGAMYSTSFVCDPAVADKVRGAVLESGSGMAPACADRLSVISSAAESDIGPVINQGLTPSSHGCGAEQTSMVGNNVETYWPDCNPGFVHANYFMLGKAHADYMDAVVVERIADLINLARP